MVMRMFMMFLFLYPMLKLFNHLFGNVLCHLLGNWMFVLFSMLLVMTSLLLLFTASLFFFVLSVFSGMFQDVRCFSHISSFRMPLTMLHVLFAGLIREVLFLQFLPYLYHIADEFLGDIRSVHLLQVVGDVGSLSFDVLHRILMMLGRQVMLLLMVHSMCGSDGGQGRGRHSVFLVMGLHWWWMTLVVLVSLFQVKELLDGMQEFALLGINASSKETECSNDGDRLRFG